MRKSLIVLVALVLSLSAFSFANISPLSSQVFLQASSQADLSCNPVVVSNGQSQGTTLNTLSTSVSAVSTCGNASVTSFADVTATWASANAGSITFGNVGWNASNVANGSALPNQGLDFTYNFLANASEALTLNYNITGGGDDGGFGLNGFGVTLTGPNGNFTFLNLPSSGMLSWNLVAGSDYSLNIKNNANIEGGLGTRNDSMTGMFSFSTAGGGTTPEPSSLLMLGTGLVGVFGVIRRRINR
jgi:hypothetical protein